MWNACHSSIANLIKVAKWTLGKLAGESVPQLTGSFILYSNAIGGEAPSIEMEWKMPMTSVSGLAVACLQLTNELYKPYKGVRTIVKSGKFHVRTV